MLPLRLRSDVTADALVLEEIQPDRLGGGLREVGHEGVELGVGEGGGEPLGGFFGVWTPGFVASRSHVTVAEYAAFLNHVEAHHGHEAALEHAPRATGAARGEKLSLVTRTPAGTWQPDSEAQGATPVRLVRPRDCLAYLAWRSGRDGVAWRLPRVFEWQRMARGADVRWYQLGNHLDPSWVCS